MESLVTTCTATAWISLCHISFNWYNWYCCQILIHSVICCQVNSFVMVWGLTRTRNSFYCPPWILFQWWGTQCGTSWKGTLPTTASAGKPWTPGTREGGWSRATTWTTLWTMYCQPLSSSLPWRTGSHEWRKENIKLFKASVNTLYTCSYFIWK